MAGRQETMAVRVVGATLALVLAGTPMTLRPQAGWGVAIGMSAAAAKDDGGNSGSGGGNSGSDSDNSGSNSAGAIDSGPGSSNSGHGGGDDDGGHAMAMMTARRMAAARRAVTENASRSMAIECG